MVIHADDVGMCHGTNVAFAELRATGALSSGSVMVPCPWFGEIAEIAAANPGLDVGVHLTLNAEHDFYRWRPVSNPPKSAGLVDDAGLMWPRVAQVRSAAHPDAVETEWRAQIDTARAAGIDITHLDAHMGSALAPEWCERYVAVGVDYELPVLITSTLARYGPNKHLQGTPESVFAEFVQTARDAGMPIFDRVLETDFARSRGATVDYPAMLNATDEALVFCAFHPCSPGPGEIEVIEPDQHHVRTDEYHIFGAASWTEWLAQQPFEVVGMRALRDEWRNTRQRS